ncbi:uncharacterized protein LOC110091999 [Dendrobium catenatum]|uniref:uncharacterized protein LOC110091999 n=1 Tax=Dendrobium catenatum TaxID=906689 RepID=UPI0009F560F1|nr:uncharacterized protein LOC110091999 [Dendrobium catenatum]
MVEDESLIEQVFIQFFEKKWRSRECQLTGWPRIAAEQKLSLLDMNFLDAEFLLEECKEAIFQQGNNKSSRVDGVTFSFFKCYWKHVGDSTWKAISIFFIFGSMHNEWKDTLIVLIPQVKNPIVPSNFRPISLCQTTYKIVSTMLVNRLKKLMPKICSEEQMAFIPGRSMSEHCILAHEIFHRFKVSKNKKWCMVVKHDMEQAYDSMGFLMECMVNVRFSIILNGKILKWISACSDDVLVFSKAICSSANLVKKIVKDFCRWTGQNVNINKFQIMFGKVVSRHQRNKVVEILGFKVVKEWKYLAIKISLRRLKVADFHDFLSQVMDRLNVSDGKKGLHYVTCSEICKPRCVGGLGVQSLAIRAGILRTRLAWNYIRNPMTLLHRTVTAKYRDVVLDRICKKNASFSMQILKDGGIQLKNIVRWKVEALISNEGNWDEGKLKMFFQEEFILLIMQVKIDTVVKMDRLETISKLSGRSLSALAYDFVFRDKYMDDDGGFGMWLKNIMFNSKVELFWWRLSKFSIPNNHFLKYRKIASDDSCARGCQEVENYEHIVVHCKYLNEAFSAIHGWGFALPKFHSLDDCLEEMRRSSAKNKSMVRLYCTGVFLFWKNRNLVKHGRAAMTSSLVAANVISLSTFKNNLYLDSWVLIYHGSLQQLGTLHR